MSAASKFEIVPMSLPYLESFWQVLDGVAREGLWLELTEAPPIDVLQKVVCDDITLKNALYIATRENFVVGWCAIIREVRQFRMHRGKVAMGVHPDFRKLGLGRRLLERCISHAEASGIGRIELEVYAHNTHAKTLYQNLGFEVEGVRRKTRALDGRYFDTIDMARLNNKLLLENLDHPKEF
jgi:ribosomal protein S18 acetylase RimI-like enzyme